MIPNVPNWVMWLVFGLIALLLIAGIIIFYGDVIKAYILGLIGLFPK